MATCYSNTCRPQNIKMAFLNGAFVPFSTTCARQLYVCTDPKRKYFNQMVGGIAMDGTVATGNIFNRIGSGGVAIAGTNINSVVGPLFNDAFDGTGNASGTLANTGQTRSVSGGGDLILSGSGYIYHDENSANIALLKYSPTVSINNTTLHIYVASQGESPYFIFNADFAGSGLGWVLYSSFTNQDIVVARYNSILPLNNSGQESHMVVGAGFTDSEILDITLTIDGDDLSLSCKGSSQTFNYPSRQYKTNTDFGCHFNNYGNDAQLHGILVPS